MKILSVQSWVSYGHVGNASAMFPLQRLGAEVLAVHTVQFSNHTGYGEWTGTAASGDQVRALIRGMAARDAFHDLDGVLCGYLGDADVGSAILEAIEAIRRIRPELLYCCDPVLGDHGTGLFVRPATATLLRERCVPAADLLTPNQYELEYLTGQTCNDSHDVLRAARKLLGGMRGQGRGWVLVTSLRAQDTPHGMMALLAVARDEAWRLWIPALDLQASGAGDLIAALFLFHALTKRDLRSCLERATASTWAVLEHTWRSGSRELSLIAAQESLVSPQQYFSADSFLI